MATEEVKKENTIRMAQISLEVLAVEVWDTLGESSMALANGMGDALLTFFEKEEGLEIAGENLDDLERELDRIFVDEFGFAKEISFEHGEGFITVKVSGCVNQKFTDKMLAAGLTQNYICPVMLLNTALSRRLGMKVRSKIERWAEGKGCKITLTKVG